MTTERMQFVASCQGTSRLALCEQNSGLLPQGKAGHAIACHHDLTYLQAALQMECMGFEGGSDVALDLMDRFSQGAHLCIWPYLRRL